MITLKRLANKLVLCAVGPADKPSYLHRFAGNSARVTTDKQLKFIHHYLAERLEPGNEIINHNEAVPYQEYGGRVDIYLAVVRAIIAAIHVKAVSQPTLALLFLSTVEKQGLSPYEKEILNREFMHPAPIQSIVRLVHTSQIAVLVYMVSLLTLDKDVNSAEGYLRELAAGLDLAGEPSWVCLPEMETTF